MKAFYGIFVSICIVIVGWMLLGDYSSPNGNLYDSHGNLDVVSRDSAGDKDVICNNNAPVNDSATGQTQIIAPGTGAQLIYICGWEIVPSGAVTASLQTGTGTNCAANTTTPAGPANLVVGMEWTFNQPDGFSFFVPAGSELCLNLTAPTQVGGSISYAGPF